MGAGSEQGTRGKMGHVTVHPATAEGVAVVQLTSPPVNALGPAVLQELWAALRALQSDGSVKAMVITGSPKVFSGGADIKNMERLGREGGPQALQGLAQQIADDNRALTDLVEAGAKPTVAAVAGLALGGGLELAMACNARVALKGAQLGLPELRLGIIPGLGGTQRLPRLVGLRKSLDMILQSKPVSSEVGKKLGLVDVLVDSPGGLLPAAVEFAAKLASGQVTRKQSLLRSDRMEPKLMAKAIIDSARAMVSQRAGNLFHPEQALDAMEVGVDEGGAEGLLAEADAFRTCIESDNAKGLIHVFLASKQTTNVPGITDTGKPPRKIQTVGVVGGGLMGSGIATACIMVGIRVVVKEINQQFLDAGMGRIADNVNVRVAKKKLSQEKADAMLALARGTLDYADFRDCDMVIEAALEQIPLKQAIFADLAKHCRPDCILATNTSTIDIDLVSEKIKDQSPRVLGAHFFSPAHVMPLFEIIRTGSTDPDVLHATIAFGKRLRKTPVTVGNCTGFAVNRVFFPYGMAASILVDRGVHPYEIDKAIKAFGMPMGPFRLNDLVGMEVAISVAKNFTDNFPERCYVSPLMGLLFGDKRLGERTAAGFYRYPKGSRKEQPDPDLAGYLDRARGQAGNPPPAGKLSPQDIVEIIFFPVVNEACRCLDERIVVKSGDLDIACVMGMGFPPYRGGVIKWADMVGARHVVSRLEHFGKTFNNPGFFAPCDYLKRKAAQGQPLELLPELARSKM